MKNANVQMLATQSQTLKRDSPVLSVLLAAEALKAGRQLAPETQALTYETFISALGSLDGRPLLHSPSALTCTATDPEGIWVAVGRMDGCINVCSVGKGSHLKPQTIDHAHAGEVLAIAMSEGRIFSVGGDRFVRCWEIVSNRNPKPVFEFPCRTKKWGPDNLAISAAANRLAFIGNRGLEIWDVSGETPRKGITTFGHRWIFSPDGNRFVRTTSGSGGPIHVTDVVTGEDIKILQGHTDWIVQIVVAKDGSKVASAGWDGTVRFWDMSSSKSKYMTGLIFAEIQQHFECVAMSHDGRWLGAGGEDHLVRLWDLTASDVAASQQVLYGHSGPITSLAFSGDSKNLISGSTDKTARVWQVKGAGVVLPSAVLYGHASSVPFIEVDPEGKWVVTGSSAGALRHWEPTGQNRLATCPHILSSSISDYHPNKIVRIVISPDDRWIASGDEAGGIRLWSTDDVDSKPRLLKGHEHVGVGALIFDSLGRTLFSGCDDGTVRKWDLTNTNMTSTKIIDFEGKSRVNSIAVLPNANLVFVVEDQFQISVWRYDSEHATFVDKMKVDRWPRITANPDGRSVYVGTLAGHLMEWRLANDKISRTNVDHLATGIMAVASNDQGTVLAAAEWSGTIHLYDTSGKTTCEFATLAGKAKMKSLVFSADGKWLYAGSEDELRGWDLEHSTDSPVMRIRGHNFETIAVSQDGKRLISGGGADVFPKLWWPSSERLLQIAQQKTGRELTEAERRQFNIDLVEP